MRAYERLLNYVTYDTTSAEGADTTPAPPDSLYLHVLWSMSSVGSASRTRI